MVVQSIHYFSGLYVIIFYAHADSALNFKTNATTGCHRSTRIYVIWTITYAIESCLKFQNNWSSILHRGAVRMYILKIYDHWRSIASKLIKFFIDWNMIIFRWLYVCHKLSQHCPYFCILDAAFDWFDIEIRYYSRSGLETICKT